MQINAIKNLNLNIFKKLTREDQLRFGIIFSKKQKSFFIVKKYEPYMYRKTLMKTVA